MWPFTTKQEAKKTEYEYPLIEIGERFKYLGIDMVCIRHWGTPHLRFPVIVANYKTSHGKVEEIIFVPAEWEAVYAENKR